MFSLKGGNMKTLSIDIETFSSVDLKKCGLYKYVQSPDFEILLFAYSVDGEKVRVIDLASGQFIPEDIRNALKDPNVTKHAYNASFEWYCLSKYLQTPLNQWHCTMFHGLYCGYPGGLGAVGDAIGLPSDKQKLGVGMHLIKLFCCPHKATATNGQRIRSKACHEPEKWDLFKKYCAMDVVAEMEVERRLSAFPVPADEQARWVTDLQMNSDGIALDMTLVEGALHCEAISTDRLVAEAIELSGDVNPRSVKKLIAWLMVEMDDELDTPITTLNKAAVLELLGKVIPDSDAERMLEIRQEVAKASVAKYRAMAKTVCEDGRVRGLFQFYGANRTGRWAGRLIQMQNLPKNYLPTLSYARELVKEKKIDAVTLVYGNVPDTLSQLIRTAFVPARGKVFLVADFSAIEARVIAWLAGEKWREDVFATHGKIYEASASAMFGVSLDTIVKGHVNYELRQKGKVAELALGYQGGAGALVNMGALKMGLREDELPEIVSRWRAASKRIVDFWYGAQNATIAAIDGTPTGLSKGLLFARRLDFANGQDFLTIGLPSGRELFYAKPGKTLNKWNQESARYYGTDVSKKWGPVETYGGKLVENITQAVARDCLAHAIDKLTAYGYKIVAHVHDEVIIEAPAETSKAALKWVCEVMGQPIPWAPGLILTAAGFVTEFYKKEG